MSRTSFGQYFAPGGRSPYAEYASRQPAHRVTELYDYVDEQQNILSPQSYGQPPVFEDDEAPDVIHCRFQGATLAFEFPPFSIAESKVMVHHLRARIARRLEMTGQEGRIKLMYKDRELKRNDMPLKKYGCKQNSEIAAILTQDFRDYDKKDREQSDSDSYQSSNPRRSTEDTRTRNRANSSVRPRQPIERYEEPRNPRPAPTENGFLHPTGTPTTGRRPPSPMRTQPPRAASPSASPVSRQSQTPPVMQVTANPSSDLGKIQACSVKFHTELAPAILKFLRNPPSDPEDRLREYRKLSVTTEKEVFEKGDALTPSDAEKDEVKATRKQLYAEAQAMLKDLDKYKPHE